MGSCRIKYNGQIYRVNLDASCDLFFKFADISGKSIAPGRLLRTGANQEFPGFLKRGVAQLAARVVRDDEVGSSSLLTPTDLG